MVSKQIIVALLVLSVALSVLVVIISLNSKPQLQLAKFATPQQDIATGDVSFNVVPKTAKPATEFTGATVGFTVVKPQKKVEQKVENNENKGEIQ